jgi:hypothetical protein
MISIIDNNTYNDTEHRIQAFQKLIQSLSPPHQYLLLYLLDIISLFATAASETKMDISNLAAVFCPGILRHPDHNTPIQYKISQHVIEFLIEFQSLFTMQLLAPTNKQKESSTVSSGGGEVPPVPLLLSSSYLPPVPLHVVNPSAPSTKSSIFLSSPNGSFVGSPSDMNSLNQLPKQRSISNSRSLSSSATTINNNQESFTHRVTKVAILYYQQLTQIRQAIQPWIGNVESYHKVLTLTS